MLRPKTSVDVDRWHSCVHRNPASGKGVELVLTSNELCRSLYMTYTSLNFINVRNFHRWTETVMYSYLQRVICTHDTYIETYGPSCGTEEKSSSNNCYVLVSIELQWESPIWTSLQLKNFLGTIFTDLDVYEALVRMNTLVLGRASQPMCMLVAYGHLLSQDHVASWSFSSRSVISLTADDYFRRS